MFCILPGICQESEHPPSQDAQGVSLHWPIDQAGYHPDYTMPCPVHVSTVAHTAYGKGVVQHLVHRPWLGPYATASATGIPHIRSLASTYRLHKCQVTVFWDDTIYSSRHILVFQKKLLPSSSTTKQLEVLHSSEIMVPIYHNTCCHIPKDHILNILCSQKLKHHNNRTPQCKQLLTATHLLTGVAEYCTNTLQCNNIIPLIDQTSNKIKQSIQV